MEIDMDIVKVPEQIVLEIKEMLKETNDESARIRIIKERLPEGMGFQLTIDEVHEDDTVEEHYGLEFLVADDLIKDFDGFTIIFMKKEGETYLQILPDRQSQGSACSASSCSSCPSSSGCVDSK